MKRRISTVFLTVFIVMLISCKGNEEEKSGITETKEEAVHEEEVKVPPQINHEVAERGEELFKNKGCIACHTIGKGRLTGPDLAGVTERRKLEWIQNMILHPEVMLEKDQIARGLLATYMVKMTNQNVKPEEAQAIIMYLREKDSEKEGGDEGAKEKSEDKE